VTRRSRSTAGGSAGCGRRSSSTGSPRPSSDRRGFGERRKPDAVIRLDLVWGVLTLLPRQAKDYTKPEFARDLYLLDLSGVTTTRSGRSLRWHASSGTRGAGVLTTVARTGQQQRYWGVSFTAEESG
jgi:hypothetical protein